MAEVRPRRVLTANLANGLVSQAALETLLGDVRPDLALFQELTPAHAEVVRPLLLNGRLRPATDYTGMGLASVSPCAIEELQMPLRAALVARCEWLTVINVHLAAPHVPPPWVSVRLRRGQLAAIRSFVRGEPGRLLVAGDLNATPVWPAYRALARLLPDLVASDAAPTWRPTPRLPYLLRIDHVLGRGLRCTRALRVPLEGGDHAALVVDVEPAEPGDASA